MHFTQVLAAIAASAFVAAAAPAGTSQGSVASEFTVSQVDTGKKLLRYGPSAMMKTFRKFNLKVPAHVLAASATAPSGTVAADPEMFDSEYLSPVQIGTPPQTVMLDFDTGSSDLWTYSGMLSAARQQGHQLYRHVASSTAKQIVGATWRIMYGDSSGASGNVWKDTVTVGGVTVTSQAVEAAESVSAQFAQDTNLDGILGLGGVINNQIKPTPQPTFFETARPSLKQKLFAAYLKKGSAGAYDFGFLNPAHYTGTIHYTPANTTQGYYAVTPQAFSVGATNYGSPGESIVDTGTSLIFAPQSVYQNYYAQVPSAVYDQQQGGVTFDCNAALPNLSFTFSGAKRTVPGSYINYAPLGDGSGRCFGGVQLSAGLPFGILGDVFIKSQYVVFNAGTSQLGFADQK